MAAVSFARHDSWFTRAFEDLAVYDAICSSKLAAARRHGVSWRAVDHMCVRVTTEALGRVDLLSGLVAIVIDEVKYKKGQRYLTVVCDHLTGKMIWAAKGRSKDTVGASTLSATSGRQSSSSSRVRRGRVDPHRHGRSQAQ